MPSFSSPSTPFAPQFITTPKTNPISISCMEKGERETRDFMNVESFSQLPFIRPAPPVKEKGGIIRLFGIEFGGKDTTEDSESADTAEMASINKDSESNSNGDNNRRFECHYCCRNFPTSQALGGHQNAHKRERQHAKRAHIQSAATMLHNGLSSDARIHGLVNYRIGSSVSASINPTSFSTTANYLSWNSPISSSNGRFYGTHSPLHHHQQPINGSPLGLWRVPPAAANSHGNASGFLRERSSMHPLPFFSSEDLIKNSQVGGGGSGGSSSRRQFGYEKKPSAQGHVSLDLHL